VRHDDDNDDCRDDDGDAPRSGSGRAYAPLLFLYPAAFRRAYGAEMRDAFERLAGDAGPLAAWKAVGRELVPTLAREHAAAAARELAGLGGGAGPLLNAACVCVACAVPALAYGWLLRHAARPEDAAAATLWFAAVGAGMAPSRGRGWAGAAGAVVGGVAAASVLIVHDAFHGSPDVLRVAPLLLLLSGGAAFTLASYVRLLVEGVELRPSPRSPAAYA
jgi:hypothetical protein